MKQRREQRAAERAQQEEELSLIARQRAEAEGLEAEAKEEEVRAQSTLNPENTVQRRVRPALLPGTGANRLHLVGTTVGARLSSHG